MRLGALFYNFLLVSDGQSLGGLPRKAIRDVEKEILAARNAIRALKRFIAGTQPQRYSNWRQEDWRVLTNITEITYILTENYNSRLMKCASGARRGQRGP